MNLLIKTIFISFLCISLNAETKLDAKLGFLSEGTLLLAFHDAKTALKVWLKDIASKEDINLEVEYYDTSERLYKLLKDGKLDMVIFDVDYFFKNRANILETSDNFWSISMGDTDYSQYYLLAKKSLKAKGFKDIKNKTLSLEVGNKGAIAWLNKNSLVDNRQSSNKVLKNIFEKKNESTVILNVFFNKSDFAIVRKTSWDIAIELNPSISRKIQIVKKSKAIHLSFIGFFRKGLNKKIPEVFFKHSEDLKNVDNADNIMEVMKFNSVFRIGNKNLKNLTDYYNEYSKLRKKYK